MKQLKHPGCVAFLVVLGLSMILSNAVQGGLGSGLSYVPLDHWSYQAFYRLSSLGLLPLHAITARPITRLEAQRLVQDASIKLSQADPILVRLAQEDIQRLATEFATDPSVVVNLAIMATNRTPAQFTPSRSLGSSSIAAQYAPSPNLLFYGRAVGGGEAWEPQRGEFYTAFRLGSVLGALGRTSVSWGPSFRSGLMLSDNAGTFPLLRLTAEIPRVRLTKVVASLERSAGAQSAPALLFATRLDWLVTPNFRIGLSESIVTTWGGPLNLYHLLEPLPLFSAIVASYDLHGTLGQDRNTVVSGDFDWLLWPGVRLYGELMIDDAPGFSWPAKEGILGGIFLSDPFGTGRTSLRLEYSAVTNGTYGYGSGLDWSYRGRSFGHWLGPDGDDLYVELTHRLNEFTTVQLSYAHTRHGQGSFANPSPAPGDWFLSGIVESRDTYALQLHSIHSAALETRYWLEIASVTNRGNLSSAPTWEGLFSFAVTYRWPTTPVLQNSEASEASTQPARPVALLPSRSGVIIRGWSQTITSTGPLAGPPLPTTYVGIGYRKSLGQMPLSLAYDSTLTGDQFFWSADLHYPVAELRDGTVSIFAGWGGIQFSGVYGGVFRTLASSGPRLGWEFYYRLAFGDDVTPFYVVGQIAQGGGSWTQESAGTFPFYLWTYSLGIGRQFESGWNVETGYRGAAASWRFGRGDMTNVRWDGLYLSVSFR